MKGCNSFNTTKFSLLFGAVHCRQVFVSISICSVFHLSWKVPVRVFLGTAGYKQDLMLIQILILLTNTEGFKQQRNWKLKNTSLKSVSNSPLYQYHNVFLFPSMKPPKTTRHTKSSLFARKVETMTSSVSAVMEACGAGSPETIPGWSMPNGSRGKGLFHLAPSQHKNTYILIVY